MAWLRRNRSTDDADPDLTPRLPPVEEPSKTAEYVEEAIRDTPVGEHRSYVRVFEYLELLRDRYDSPLYLGVNGRPAVLLRVSSNFRANLDGLDELLRRKGARLYLQGHRFGEYGMVRAVLELPERDLIYESPLTLAHGDVQEFLAGAYRDEAVELHIGHIMDGTTLHLMCQVAELRPVVDAALANLQGAVHPVTPDEQAAPAAQLEAKFPNISAGLTGRSRVRLAVTGTAESVMQVETSL